MLHKLFASLLYMRDLFIFDEATRCWFKCRLANEVAMAVAEAANFDPKERAEEIKILVFRALRHRRRIEIFAFCSLNAEQVYRNTRKIAIDPRSKYADWNNESSQCGFVRRQNRNDDSIGRQIDSWAWIAAMSLLNNNNNS